MEVVIIKEVPPFQQGEKSVRPGDTIRQILLKDDTPEGFNFRLVTATFLSGTGAYESPRHHHAFQQIRWAASGAINYGPGQDIPESDIAYFPRGAYYGPQRKDKGVSFTLQFGFDGEHLSGPKYDDTRDLAVERLRARGKIENGIFIDVDPKTGARREEDVAQALYEEQYAIHHSNRKFVVPPEGYDAPVLMHTGAFAYYTARPGVEIKNLGHFFDHAGPRADLRISMVRLAKGATYTLSAERAQLGWTRDDGLKVGERAYPEMTCFYSKLGEESALSAAEDGIEIYLIEFPRRD